MASLFWSHCSHKHPSETEEPFLVEKSRELSKEIDKLAQKLDLALVDKPYTEDQNNTRLTLYNRFSVRESNEQKYIPHLGLRLDLPNVQKKLQVQFTSYDEDYVERGVNKRRHQGPQEERAYGSSIGLFQQLGRVKTVFRPRVEFTDQFETSYILKFFSEFEHKYFVFEPEVQLFARSDVGTGQFVSLNMDFQISSSNVLTIVNEQEYTDGDNKLSTNHGLDFEHQYNENMSQEYSYIIEADNRETFHLQQSVLKTTFSQTIYQGVLEYDLTPSLTFSKSESFHPRSELTLGIDVIF